MTTETTPHRRRSPRGGVARGILVASGLAGAVALQVTGGQLQSRLATMVGIARPAPAPLQGGLPAPMPVRGLKVASTTTTGHAPVI